MRRITLAPARASSAPLPEYDPLDLADARVARSLYDRAVGFSCESARSVLHQGWSETKPSTSPDFDAIDEAFREVEERERQRKREEAQAHAAAAR